MVGREEDPGLGAAHPLDTGEVQGVLADCFYASESEVRAHVEAGGSAHAPRARRSNSALKPAHYKVVCISLYTKDIDRLDRYVDQLKARGITKANRSALIRVALEQLDLDKVPRGL